MAKEWRSLTRADLKGFDKEPKALIMWATERGAVGRISSKGHAILRAADGVRTASVSPKWHAEGRSSRNVRAEVARLLRE